LSLLASYSQSSEDKPMENYPGIDRQQYFFGKLGMVIVAILAVMLFGPHSPVVQYVGLGLLITSLILDVLRLQNIGLTIWLALIRFAPFGNLILDLGLQSAQTGWVETRRLDDTGKRILIFNLVLMAILFLLAMRAGTAVPMYI
jgi:hypothetical protein